MTDLIESPIWTEQIFQKEIDTLVEGGLNGPSNNQAREIACRTQKIKEILKENSIYIDDANYVYRAQNIIFTADFFGTVSDGDFVYWHEVEELFYKAKAGVTEAQSEVSGIADVTNGRVIVEGLISTNLTPTPGDKIYLSASTSGASTTDDTGISLGYYIKPGIMRLLLHYNFSSDPIATIPGLRTLGTTSQKACSGNDSRLDHTGDVTSDSSGITVINDGVVTEAKQILDDNDTHNISIIKHGYVPKSANVGHFLKDDGTWAAISGGGGTPITLQNAVCGDIIIGRQDLEFQTENYVDFEYYILEEFTIPLAGNYRIKWDLYGHLTWTFAQIYNNYQLVSNTYSLSQTAMWKSFSADIGGWNPGDLCQLAITTRWINTYVKNFKLCVGNPCVGARNKIFWNNVIVS